MDIFFHDKKTYTTHLPPDFIRHELMNLSAMRWYKLSPGNLGASLNADDSFIIKTKFAFMPFWSSGWLGPFVILRGQLEEQNNQTIITTIARPNYAATIILFVSLFMTIPFAVNDARSKEDDIPAWIAVLIVSVLLGSAMFFAVRSLRNRFEKVFRLH
jgi:hypothetical protein